MSTRLEAYFALNAAHPLPARRVGSVLLAERPGWRIDVPSPLAGVGPLAADLDVHAPANLAALLPKAASVGRVAVAGGNGLGTAFLIPGGNGRRMLTAGHVFEALLKPRNAIRQTHPVPAAIYQAAEVRFGADGTSGAIAIAGWVLVHPIWDLAILELSADPPGNPLTIGAAPAAGATVAVIGFPSTEPPQYGSFGVQAVGVRHLSAGLLRSVGQNSAGPSLTESYFSDRTLTDIAPEFRLTHDASTMNGHSGAPLFDIASGTVIGMHLAGSRMNALGKPETINDWNDAILLAEILKEPWLENQVNGDGRSTSGRLFPQSLPDWRAHEGPSEASFIADQSPFFAEIAPDRPDSRDYDYVPVLLAPKPSIWPPKDLPDYNQGREASCAAFAVAMTIDRQLRRGAQVSVRMLDRMARNHDEWLDDDGAGTSLRAVVKGFYHNGVCPMQTAPYIPGDSNFLLTRDIATKARAVSLGAYFRVGRSIPHMQMSVQETGAVAVSARVHEGWLSPERGKIVFDGKGTIKWLGMHAFAVVGYNREGFLVQNSWGKSWGATKCPGVALWHYADWWESVEDAWVLRVAASAPAGFELPEREPGKRLPRPRRVSLIGHVSHVERDGFVTVGSLGLGLRSVCETAHYLGTRRGRDRYRTLALIFHDPFIEVDTIERLVANATPRLKAAGFYPFNIAYGVDEIRTLGLRIIADAQAAQCSFAKSGASPGPYIARRVASVVRRQIDVYRDGARQAAEWGPLWSVVAALTKARTWPSLAIVSAGAGVIPADACIAADRTLQAKGDAPLFAHPPRRLAIAPPVPPEPGAIVWSLKDARTDGAIAGYPGEWSDLVAAATGGTQKVRSGGDKELAAATVEEALTDIAELIKQVSAL